jgi:hypothetical protein
MNTNSHFPNGNLYYSFFGVLGYLDSVTSQRGVTVCVKWQTQRAREARVIAMCCEQEWASEGRGVGSHFMDGQVIELCSICIAWSTGYGQKIGYAFARTFGGKLRLFE